MYQPDAIATFRSGNQTYLVTANEGDVREYDGLNAAEREPWRSRTSRSTRWRFPMPRRSKDRTVGIGRLKVTSFNGDTDGDADYEQLYTVRRTVVLDLVTRWRRWCSTAATRSSSSQRRGIPTNFNASNTNNTLDDRSDDKGPEPEGSRWRRCSGAPTSS